VKSEAIAVRVQQAPNGEFRDRIAAANSPHDVGSNLTRNSVHEPIISRLQLVVTAGFGSSLARTQPLQAWGASDLLGQPSDLVVNLLRVGV
jgi:hypothetical protein